MNYKKWSIPTLNKPLAMQIAEECEIDSFTALLLTSRGMTDPLDIEEFLSDDTIFSDPYEYKDMMPAVERIRRAITDFEKIAIFGDYDCDGITSTTLIYDYLSGQGADVIYYVPNRSEGYGMNIAAVDRLKSEGVSLIITVDNGISAIPEIKHAADIGIDTVVTDHHIAGEELPPAVAVVDPHRSDCPGGFKQLAGVGVAFKLVCALENRTCEEMLSEYSDLLTIGTIADVMPLTGENRGIVKYGVKHMARSRRPGITALLAAAGYENKPLTATAVAFTLAPRLNAAGRMGDSARGVRLLTETDEAAASALAEEICEDNVSRQQTESKIVENAVKQIEENNMQLDRVIVCSGENWHHGVIGIAAARLCEKYGRPVIVMSDDGEFAVGSGRSIKGFNIYDAIDSCKAMLTKFGGHPLAAGLTLKTEDIDNFRRQINEFAAEKHPEMPFPEISLDCKLNPAALSLSLADTVTALAPFGMGNPVPMFALCGMKIENIQEMGGGKHTRLFLSKKGAVIRCVMFGQSPSDLPFDRDDIVDAAVTLEINLWQGEEHLSIQIKDIRPSGVDDEFFSSLRAYERFRLFEDIDYSKVLISREDAAAVFRLVRGAKGGKTTREYLINKLCGKLTPAKILTAVDVLCELSVLKDEKEYISVCNTAVKVNLEASEILKNIRLRVSEI